MSHANIKKAFLTAFVAGSFFDSSLIEQENVSNFNPPASGPWCSIFYMPSETSVATLGDTGEDEYRGYFQINLNYPLGNGSSDAQAKGDSIKDAFFAGRKLTESDTYLVIQIVDVAKGVALRNCYRIPIFVRYYARVNR